MKLSIPFNEIKEIIDQKVKQPISFEYVNDNTIRVNYDLNLGFMRKTIGANIEIKGIKGSDLFLGYPNSTDQMMVSSALKMFGDKIPDNIVEEEPGGNLTLHLANIKNVKKLFDNLNVNNILVTDNGLDIEGQINTSNI